MDDVEYEYNSYYSKSLKLFNFLLMWNKVHFLWSKTAGIVVLDYRCNSYRSFRIHYKIVKFVESLVQKGAK